MGRHGIRVYRPVVPVLIAAVGKDVLRLPRQGFPAQAPRASSRAAFTPALIFRNRNAVRGPWVQNPAERIVITNIIFAPLLPFQFFRHPPRDTGLHAQVS